MGLPPRDSGVGLKRLVAELAVEEDAASTRVAATLQLEGEKNVLELGVAVGLLGRVALFVLQVVDVGTA